MTDRTIAVIAVLTATVGMVSIVARTLLNDEDKAKFQIECNTKCAPLPGVVDTRKSYARAWVCGCVPPEAKLP